MIDQLEEMKKTFAGQLDKIDLSPLPKDQKDKFKQGLSKIKASLLSDSVNLQQDINDLIREVSSKE